MSSTACGLPEPATDVSDSPGGSDPPGDTDPVDGAGLLDRLVADLDTGFVDLVREFERPVYSVALRLTDRHSDAEDIAAEAFLRAYRALRGFDAERIARLRPRPWLMTIVLNVWRNTVRGRSRRPDPVSLTDLAEPESTEPGVEERTELNEQGRELARLVALLPPPQRVAVVLRHVVGLPVPEIAAVLGCPDGTAKSHISRGLRRLRDSYRENDPDTPPESAVGAGVAVGRRVRR